MKVVIVGGVAGGATFATRLRRLNSTAQIIMLEATGYVSFANCGLPYYCGDYIKDKNLLTLMTPEKFQKDFNIDARVNTKALKIDSINKIITIKDLINNQEYQESYDKLILSTGATPFLPNIEGLKNNKKVFVVKSLEDAEAIKTYIINEKPKSVAVIGGGFIGIEMAENTVHQKINTHLIESSDQVLAMLDKEFSNAAKQELLSNGVKLHLNSTLTSITNNQNNLTLTLKNLNNQENTLDVDFIIAAIGVKPNTELAETAGIKLGITKGILVNDYLETSQKDIYAIGDAIEVTDKITKEKTLIPLASPANKQARLLATNFVSQNPKSYQGTLGTSILKVFNQTFAKTGASEKTLKKLNIPYLKTYVASNSHASYYGGAKQIYLKVLFNENQDILGVQGFGELGVDKRIDIFATAISTNTKITDLTTTEFSYAPPYSSAKDIVNVAAMTAENILHKLVNPFYIENLTTLSKNDVIIDVRSKEAYNQSHIAGAINIPLKDLANQIANFDTNNQKIILACNKGLTSYLASRELFNLSQTTQLNTNNIYSLVGGYSLYLLYQN